MVCGGCDGSELEWWDESDMTECGGEVLMWPCLV
jgi:hypothetical protein